MTRKNQPFVWGPSQQEAFEGMKDRLCTSPVLAYPNFNLPFIMTTDASKLAVAAVLSQVQDGAERQQADEKSGKKLFGDRSRKVRVVSLSLGQPIM